MDSFKDREKNFEKKFAHDEELKFKISARRNKYLGQWASQILGYDQEKEKEYIQSIIKADFEEPGDEDVFRKLKTDLKDHNIPDEEIRKKIEKKGERTLEKQQSGNRKEFFIDKIRKTYKNSQKNKKHGKHKTKRRKQTTSQSSEKK